jgi:hypothetical protein
MAKNVTKTKYFLRLFENVDWVLRTGSRNQTLMGKDVLSMRVFMVLKGCHGDWNLSRNWIATEKGGYNVPSTTTLNKLLLISCLWPAGSVTFSNTTVSLRSDLGFCI